NIANGIELKITDPDRNIDTKTKDTFTGLVAISMDTIPGTYTAIPFQETDFNSGIFVPQLTDQAIGVSVAPGGSGINNTAGISLTPFDISQNNNLFIKYNDPAAFPNVHNKNFQIVDTVHHTLGGISSTTPTAGINAKFSVTITDNDLNLNSD